MHLRSLPTSTPRSFLALLAAKRSLSLPLHAEVAHFDATTDTSSIAGQTVLGTTATFEARLMFQPGGSRTIYTEQANGQEDKRLALNESGPSAIAFTLGTNQTGNFAPVAVSSGVFHHVAFVRDGSEERLYLDGSLVGSRTVSGDIRDSASTAPAVGAQFLETTSFMAAAFIGDIDTLRISNVARYSGPSFAAPTGDLASDAGTLGAGFAGASPPEISAVPEPASAMLLLAGGALLGCRKYRSARSQPS